MNNPRKARPEIARLTRHVDPAWAEAFVVEARIQGLPGPVIADALATVDSHLADAGESVADAFGEPAAYAREVAASDASPRSTITAATAGSAVLGLVSLLIPVAVGNWLTDTSVHLTGTGLIVVLAVLAGTVAILRYPAPILRFLAERRWVGALVGGGLPLLAFVGLIVAGNHWWPGTWLTVSPLVVFLVGLAATLAATYLNWIDLRPDPITGPGEPAPDRRSVLDWVTVFMHPIVALALSALAWLLYALTT